MSKRERSPRKTSSSKKSKRRLEDDKLKLGQTYLRVGRYEHQQYMADLPYQEVVKLIEIDDKKYNKYTFINARNEKYREHNPLQYYAYFKFNVPLEVLSNVGQYLGGKMRKTQKSKKQYK